MSRVCDICGRGPRKAIKRSHANNKTIVRKYINLQSMTIDGTKKRICAKCMRTLKKQLT